MVTIELGRYSCNSWIKNSLRRIFLEANNSCNTKICRFNFNHFRHNREEEQTVGIDLSNSCSFSNLHDEWQMAIQGDYEKEADMQEEQKQLGIMGKLYHINIFLI